ncbi:hypothetical protein CUMW_148360 [Citrus unshiu]|uniref:Uncharacterized protein n=1 Tax=Citrus unshiu TaxID=55188 RepID=A0A2H5PMI4_CITUN|nr:hypothetical protein CUMW_148360 [Citrus unshiu]
MGNTLQTPKENLEKEEEKEEESSGSSFTCEICIEPMAASKKFKNKHLCTHPFLSRLHSQIHTSEGPRRQHSQNRMPWIRV